MPFTPAHIAAALPFRRSHLVWSAVVTGTMAPDFEYFLRLAPGYPYGHTLPGVFFLTLPVALIALWLFHTCVKPGLIELLPRNFAYRLDPYSGGFHFGPARRFLLIVVSVLVGILTHLIWDSFTHDKSWLVHRWLALRYPVHIKFLGTVPLYKLLQHGSTAFGLAVLSLVITAWYRQSNAGAPLHSGLERGWPLRKILTLLDIGAIAVVTGLVYAILVSGVPTRHSSISTFVGRLVVTAMAVLWWQLVVMGIVHSRKRNAIAVGRS